MPFTNVSYDYDGSTWTQGFFGTVTPGIEFNHQGGQPILSIETFDNISSTATVSARYGYAYLNESFNRFFIEPEPQVNSTFLHTDGTTTLNIDTVDSVNFDITVSAVP